MMKTVAELVDELFRTHRKRNGREYTYTEIVEALDGAIDPSSLSKLRYGQVKNPSRETLLALCRFFKVPATYFFPELEEVKEPNEGEVVDESEDPIKVAMRSTTLTPGVQKKLSDLIRALEKGD